MSSVKLCLFFPLPYPSPGSPGAQKKDCQKWLWTFVLVFFFDRVFNMVLDSFWDPFGAPYGVHFGSFGHPNRAKIGPRQVLRPHFLENLDFHETLRFPMKNDQN